MNEFLLLLLAASLEVGGDAFIRVALKSNRLWAFPVGAIVLFLYGLSVNLPQWNFSRLMGIYIALFFVISQLVAVLFFQEKLPLPIYVGGSLILAGALVMTLWHTPA